MAAAVDRVGAGRDDCAGLSAEAEAGAAAADVVGAVDAADAGDRAITGENAKVAVPKNAVALPKARAMAPRTPPAHRHP